MTEIIYDTSLSKEWINPITCNNDARNAAQWRALVTALGLALEATAEGVVTEIKRLREPCDCCSRYECWHEDCRCADGGEQP
ncbi:MAG: hypothetical protein V1755_05275 [Chloroflexota bacterium]